MAEETKNPETPVTTPKREGQPFEIPVLPLQNTTLFPDTMVPLAVVPLIVWQPEHGSRMKIICPVAASWSVGPVGAGL